MQKILKRELEKEKESRGSERHEMEDKDLFGEDVCVVQIEANGANQGKICGVSDRCQSVFEYTREQLVGQNVSILMPPIYARIHQQVLFTNIQQGREAVVDKTVSTFAVNKEGSLFEIRIYVTVCSSFNDKYLLIYSSKVVLHRRLAETQAAAPSDPHRPARLGPLRYQVPRRALRHLTHQEAPEDLHQLHFPLLHLRRD